MARVHPVFHVSMLRKYIRDPELKIESDPIIIQQDLTINAQPVRVLEFSEHVMRNRTIKCVKILWSNQTEREATWELESIMCNKYPNLFETGKFFVVHVSPIFLWLCRRSGRIRGRILFRGGGGGECNTKKILERGSGVDRKFDFLNRCSDSRSETADAKISSKHDCFTIHMLDSEVGWIMYE
jgi:hypothetical protein